MVTEESVSGVRAAVGMEGVTLAPFRPYNICHTRGLNSQPHYDTDHYTPYPKYRPWSRLSHSHASKCLMYFISAL